MILSRSTFGVVRFFCVLSVAFVGLISNAQSGEELPSFAEEMNNAQKANKHSCQILVVRNGTMVQNIGATKMSSQINAGLSGQAEVTTTNGSYRVVIDPPTGFTSSPQGGNQDVDFDASFEAHGATNFANSPGQVPVKMKKGVTQLDIHLEATKLSGAFRAGHYKSELTLRCE